MKRSVVYIILTVLASGIFFIAYQWYGNYKINKELEQMNLDKNQMFHAKCDCWTSHAENALSAYQQGNDSLLREIIRSTPCEEVVHREEGYGLSHSSWSIYFDHLKACEYKHTDVLDKSLLKVLKPEIDAKCEKCLSVISDMDYISGKSKDKFRESGFLYECYPFYEMVGQRINTKVIDAVAFVTTHDLVIDQKIVSIKRLIRKHKNYKYLTRIDGIPKMNY